MHSFSRKRSKSLSGRRNLILGRMLKMSDLNSTVITLLFMVSPLWGLLVYFSVNQRIWCHLGLGSFKKNNELNDFEQVLGLSFSVKWDQMD